MTDDSSPPPPEPSGSPQPPPVPEEPQSTPPPVPQGHPAAPPPVPPPVPPTATAPTTGSPPGVLAAPVPKSGKAVASMVLGIVGLVLLFCGWIFLELPSLILGILAIVFGHLGKQEIRENPGMEGEGQAKAGFIMGIIATSLAALWFVIIVVAAIADS